MKGIVTGGSGFLGSHVADVLAERGSDITVVDLADNPKHRTVRADLMEVDGLGRVIDYMQEAVGPLAKELDSQQAALTALSTEAAQLRAQKRHLEREIAALRRSRSWRLTEPVRRGSTLVRRVLGR